MLRQIALNTAIVFIYIIACQHTLANERVKSAVEHLASDDLLMVAAIELDGRWVTGLQKELGERLGEEGNILTGSPAFAMALGFVESFRSAGAKELVLVQGAGDLNAKAGGIAALTTDSPEQAAKVRQLLEGLRAMLPGGPDLATTQQDSLVLVGLKPAVERYAGRQADGEIAVAEKLASLLQSDDEHAEGGPLPKMAILVAPGEEPRRVIRELWPTFPKPFRKITGEMLADEVHYLAVEVTSPPEWELRVTVDTASENTAKLLEQNIHAAWDLVLRKLQENKTPEAPWPTLEVIQRAAHVLTPARDGTVLEITASHDDPEMVELTAAVLLPPIRAAREAARRNSRLNNLKQMALAMHNYHDTLKSFPASSAIVDKQGKPLLSWRVAVLPFLEGQTLYNQFHFDEPWDSPHNLKLLAQMPDVYKDASHPELSAEGKTTYQLPVHSQSAFPPSDGTSLEKPTTLLGRQIYLAPGRQLREITDGTSNTVMIVQVPPELAVPWTKPADWEVNLANAWQQLRGKGRGEATAAFCDGSAHVWDLDDEWFKENLPKFITRDGEEIVER
ncbi:DUF1559 domain-containing protein [Aeoliella sp. ICT_H6.2]|uniref:DUF1559 domain-containing protein n=1 Tax=Aeoliella straminimaris TaxID=2954799 RepID=A0A9X2FBG4_9BACT|nr:DUF1559 domain-containing protein [Aeoliella straminimaris]MCO6042996.1 DUF1559 domain-containing protein [Aeoliella straminimaris]